MTFVLRLYIGSTAIRIGVSVCKADPQYTNTRPIFSTKPTCFLLNCRVSRFGGSAFVAQSRPRQRGISLSPTCACPLITRVCAIFAGPRCLPPSCSLLRSLMPPHRVRLGAPRLPYLCQRYADSHDVAQAGGRTFVRPSAHCSNARLLSNRLSTCMFVPTFGAVVTHPASYLL